MAIVAKDDYRYRHITMNDGLLANSVRNIVQDRYGFIWFGTDNGLCRYDGTKIQAYRIPELGINQYISTLLTVQDGLYIGTESGVFFDAFDGKRFTKLPLDIHSAVTRLAIDKDSALWVSTMTQGVWRYVPDTRQVRQYDIKDTGEAIAQVFVDNDNQVWTVTKWGKTAVQKLNRQQDRFEPVALRYPDNYGALSMLQTKDGRLWLGSWEQGLLLLHGDGHLEQVLSPAVIRSGQHIHTLYERSDGCICIGCDDGLLTFNPMSRDITKGVLGMNDAGISDRFVYAITEDVEGGLWIGTYYGGVKYISPLGKRFEGFSLADGLSGNVVSRFCDDGKDHVWIASDDGGLMCFAPEERRFLTYPHQEVLKALNVHALCVDDDNCLWIGTYTGGVHALNLASGSLRTYQPNGSPNSLDSSSSYAIYKDGSGRLWVATLEGLSLYNRETDDFTQACKTNAVIIDIDEDRKGNLWLSTGDGLFRYHVQTKQQKRFTHTDSDTTSIADNQVNCMLIDEAGRQWVGTAGGLCLYDAANDCFRHITLRVPSHNIMGIIADRGVLWLATERGIVKYDPASEEDPQRFTRYDGLVSEQFQPNACMKAGDGRIYMGTTSGFCTFYPSQLKANGLMPPVYVTSLEILNHEQFTPDGLPMQFLQDEELSFSYSDARMISFSFAALSFCSPEKNQYAYMMEGFDSDWNYVDNLRKATYTNLPAGTYTFRVKATNNDGIWSAHEAAVRIVVHPPFWWSWYAKLFYLLLVVGVVWYYVHFRLKREENRHQRELLVTFLSTAFSETSPSPSYRRGDGSADTPLLQEGSGEPSEDASEAEFLARMNQVIEENFSNPDLNVKFLAEKLNISRSGLFAKIKTMADVTPNEMIQIVRLKKAARLLKEGGRPVSEVCYMVGFSSPSYFSKCFQKQFGVTPGTFGSSGDDDE